MVLRRWIEFTRLFCPELRVRTMVAVGQTSAKNLAG